MNESWKPEESEGNPIPCLEAEDYPVLAQLWDNNDDAIFDTM